MRDAQARSAAASAPAAGVHVKIARRLGVAVLSTFVFGSVTVTGVAESASFVTVTDPETNGPCTVSESTAA